MPASASRQRDSMAATVISTARQCSLSRRSWRAEVAKSSSASPNASSWNWRVDPVADFVASPRVSSEVRKWAFVGHRPAVDPIGGFQLRSVGKDTLCNEVDGVIEQRMRLVHRNCLTGIALVANPGVAVVVVAALFGAFGQAHRGCRHHPATGTGQTAQHGVSMSGVAGCQRV